MMAMRAGNGVFAAQNRVEIEQFAEFNLGRGERVFLDRFHSWERLLQARRARLALAPGLIRLVAPLAKGVARDGLATRGGVNRGCFRTNNHRGDGKETCESNVQNKVPIN